MFSVLESCCAKLLQFIRATSLSFSARTVIFSVKQQKAIENLRLNT